MRALRAAFVNCGILGHAAMGEALVDVARLMAIDATHINLSDGLTVSDRLVRSLLSIKLVPATGALANVDLRRWRQELNFGLLARRRLTAAERRGAFDVLHFHTQNTAYASLARMRRTPAIVSIDATSRLARGDAASAVGRASYAPNVAHDGAVFRAARAIVATSEWAARDLAAGYPDCADRIHVLPYPVKDVFDSSWASERAARAAKGAPVHVLFIGGDFPRKGGNDLLAAWRDGGLHASATLDLVTDWPVDASALPPGVRMVRGVAPYSSAWRDLWRRADVFVMPSRHESFGIVYEEAAAAGVPAVGTAINAVPEIIVDGETGFLVRARDRGALVHALRTLIATPDLRRALGTAARARVQRTAFPEVYAARLGAIVASVTPFCHVNVARALPPSPKASVDRRSLERDVPHPS
jgi:alpha-maltose-1-phosphate synthase